MIITMKEILHEAMAGQFGVGSFNIYNYETIKGVLEASKEQKLPVILAFGEKYLQNMDFETVYALVNSLSYNMDLPVALHLDHCSSLENVYRAIKAGFTSVMYDGSALPFKENIANTLKVVEIAHSCNVSVEAELGSLATGTNSNEGKVEEEEVYTNPRMAQEFVAKTRVDALAVSIGTVHGLYKGIPNIRVDILKKIKEKVSIPLVLHGGSGTDEQILKECIQNGICKVNVNTEISVYTLEQTKHLLNRGNGNHLSEVSLAQISYVKEVVSKYIKLLNLQY